MLDGSFNSVCGKIDSKIVVCSATDLKNVLRFGFSSVRFGSVRNKINKEVVIWFGSATNLVNKLLFNSATKLLKGSSFSCWY